MNETRPFFPHASDQVLWKLAKLAISLVVILPFCPGHCAAQRFVLKNTLQPTHWLTLFLCHKMWILANIYQMRPPICSATLTGSYESEVNWKNFYSLLLSEAVLFLLMAAKILSSYQEREGECNWSKYAIYRVFCKVWTPLNSIPERTPPPALYNELKLKE